MRNITRIHVPGPLTPGAEVELPESAARHVARVLRLREEDEVVLFDGAGGEHEARLHDVTSRRVSAICGAYADVNRASPLEIELVQGVARGQRMDFCIQKATELGVRRIRPVIAARTVVKLTPERAAARRNHWQGVASSACEQCGLNLIPEVLPIEPLADWLGGSRRPPGLHLMLSTRSATGIAALAPPDGAIMLLVGPEGGLAPREVGAALAAGFESVSLGPRVLRTETAAPVALSALQLLFGDLGNG